MDSNNEDLIKNLTKSLIKLAETAKKVSLLSEFENTLQVKSDSGIDIVKKDFNSLLEELSIPTKSFKMEIFLTKLDNYLASNHRLLYSEFTNTIISCNVKNDQKVGIIISNLERCIDYSTKEKNNVSEIIQKTLIKLWDHANLASNQYNYFMMTDDAFLEKVKPILDSKIIELKNEYESLSSEVENAKIKLEFATNDAKNIKNKITSDIIAMISIFVGIAFVMFGGMTLLNNLFDFSDMKTIPLIELICLGSLMGIIIITIIYAFITFVLRLTEKDIKKSELINLTLIVLVVILFLIFVTTFSIWNNFF